MLRKVVSTLLSNYLGRYVEGLEDKKLGVSVSNGDLELSELRLRDDSLDDLELPVMLQAGYLQTLKLTIPWLHLSSKPTIIEISDVYLLVGPKDDSEFTAQELLERLWNSKQRVLQLSTLSESDEDSSEDTFLSKTMAKIAANVQITIKNIHLRYQSSGSSSYAFGITLDSLLARTTNREKVPVVVKAKGGVDMMYKLITLNNLAVYWNSYSPAPPTTSKQDVIEFLQCQIHTKTTPVAHMNYIIHPFNAEAFCEVNTSPEGNMTPKLKFLLSVADFNVSFSQTQYREMQSFMEFIHNYSKSFPFLRFRPRESIQFNPAAWWNYLFKSLKHKNQVRSWSKTKQFIEHRNSYVDLWYRKKMASVVNVKLTEQQKELLTKLERFHELDDILLFRQIAMDKVLKRKEQIEEQKAKKKAKSLFSFGKKKAKQLFEQIRSNSEDVKYHLEFNGSRVSFELLDLENKNIFRSELSDMAVNCLVREGTISVQSSIHTITARDCVTENSQFPQILFHSTSTNKFFHSELLISPGDLVPYKLSATMQPMTMVPAPLLFRKLNDFAQPVMQQGSINDLELAFFLRFQELKHNTQRKLKELIQQGNINIGLQLELCGPQILLASELHSESSPMLILSLGNLSVRNEEISPLKPQQLPTTEDRPFAELHGGLKDSLYNRYRITLTDVYATYSTIEKYKNSHLEAPQILESFTSTVICNLCKVYHPKFPAVQFTAHTPPITMNLTSQSFQSLRELSSSFLTKLGTSEASLDTDTTQQVVSAIQQYKEAEKKFHEQHKELVLPEASLFQLEFCIDELQLLLEDDFMQEQKQFAFAFSFHELSGSCLSTTYQTEISFNLASCSLYGSLQEKQNTRIELIGTNAKNFAISPELRAQLPRNSDKLIKLKWKQIPDSSPLYHNISNEMTINGNQIICYADLEMLDGFLRLLKRSFVTQKDQPAIKPYKKVLKTSQAVIKSLVQKAIQESFFVKGNLSLECITVLVPSHERTMELSFARSRVSVSCDSSLSSYCCTGDLGTFMTNLPLKANEPFFPHVLFIRGTSPESPCLIDAKYSTSDTGDTKITVHLNNATVVFPTSQLNQQSLHMDLNRLVVEYISSGHQQSTSVTVADLSLSLMDNNSSCFPILHRTNASLKLVQRKQHPHREVTVKIDPIELRMSKREFIALLQTTVTKEQLMSMFSNAIEDGKAMIESMKRSKQLTLSADSESLVTAQTSLSIASISFQFHSLNDETNQTSPMGLIQLEGVRFTSKQFENEATHTLIEVQELRLQDNRDVAADRPFQEMITHRLPAQQEEQFGTDRLQCRIEMESSPAHCPRIAVSIDQTYFLIIPDFWADFVPAILPLHKYLMQFKEMHQSDALQSDLPVPSEPEREKMSLEFYCRATSPEICVLEDPTKFDTPALVVLSNVLEISTFFHAMNRGMLLKLKMKGNQLAKCNLRDPTGTFVPLVQPFTVEVTSATSTTDETNTTHIVVQPIEATFSFQDYKLALSIYHAWVPSIQRLLETLNPTLSDTDEPNPSELNEPTLLSNETKKIVKDTLSEAREQLKHLASGLTTPTTTGTQQAAKIISISFHGGRLVLINDTIFNSRYNPVLMVHCKASEVSVDWLDGISCEANTVMSIDYYNTAVEVWEPLLEPWIVAIKFLQSGERTEFSIDSDSIDLNVSKIFLDSLQAALRVLVDVASPVSKDAKSNSQKFLEEYTNASPYYIRNESGLSLFYSLSSYKPYTRLRDNEETSLQLDVHESSPKTDTELSSWKGRQLGSHQTLFVQLDDPHGVYTRQDRISFHKVGTHKLQVSHDSKASNIATLDISFRHGCKVITVRSNSRIHNQCDRQMDIMISSPPLHAPTVLSVAPGEILSIPVYYVEGGEFSIAPSNTHQFSEPVSLSVDGIVGCCCAQSCEGSIENPFDYFMWVAVEGQVQDKIFHLLPPLSITNALPITIECVIKYTDTQSKCDHQIIPAGATVPVHLANFSKTLENGIILSPFGLSENILPINIPKTPELSTFTFTDDEGRSFLLRQENLCDAKTSERKITVFSDFWIMNRTGLPLLYKTPKSTRIEAGQHESCFTLLQGDPRDWYPEKASPPDPFLYSNSSKNVPMCIQVAESQWSEAVDLSTEQMFRCLSITGQEIYDNVPQYELAVTVKPSSELFWRTREVIIVPRFLLVNETNSVIHYHQCGLDSRFILSPAQQLPYHWSNASLDQSISLTKAPADNKTFRWSSPIKIDKLGIQTVKLRAENNLYEYAIISVHVLLDKSSNVTLVVIKENTEYPDLVVDNQLEIPIQISQSDCKIIDSIPRKTRVPFAWDNLEETNEVKVAVHGKIFKFSFEQFMSKKLSVPTSAGQLESIQIEIVADGPTRVLQFSNEEIVAVDFSESLLIDEEEFVPLGEERAPIELSFCIAMGRIGLSLIDDTPREVLYGVMEDIEFSFAESKTHQNFLFKLRRLQIDNQLVNAAYPIFFYPVLPAGSEDEGFFLFNAIKNVSMKSINYFEHFFVSIGEMDIKADEEVVDNLMGFIWAVRDFTDSLNIVPEGDSKVPLYFSASTETMLQMKMFFFDRLIINPIRIHISTHSGTGSAKISQRLPMRGKLLGNIEDAVIDCKGLTLNHPFVSKEELITQITKHYKQAFLIQMYKIIGSAEILGNPISLLSNMGTGVSDFFTEPMKAIATSPADFGSGLKRGTTSLVHKSVYGIANSAGKVTGGLAHLASFFTFDEEYQREWATAYRSARGQPTGAVDSFQRAAQNAGSGVVQALVGVVNSPIQGARTGGATGAIVGTLRGTSGVLVKPLVSVFGSASIMAQGIGNTLMNWEETRTRVRLPRYIGENGVLQPYNKDQAAGHLLLQCIGNGKFADEWYQNSFSVTEGVLVLSNNRILIVKDSYIVFDLEFTNVRGFQLTSQYIIVLPIIPPPRSYLQYSKPAAEKYIFPTDSEGIELMYEELLSSVASARARISE